jgi:hypothetical protein
MKKPRYLLKAITIISSVLLVAGFIAYRAGAIDWLLGTGDGGEPEQFMSSSKVKTLFFGLGEGNTTSASPVTGTQVDPAFMSSSKSIILVSPAKTKDVPAGSPPSKPSP